MFLSTATLFASLCALASAAPTPVREEAGLLATRTTSATGGVVSGNGLSWYNSNLGAGTTGLADTGSYTCYTGPAANFPPITKWMNFNAAWTQQSKVMAQYAGDTQQQLTYMHDAIVSISQAAKVDARVILAVILQESGGKVTVGCTTSSGGVNNCGLMQAYNSDSYNASMPKKSINLMIQQGTQGTQSGPGLAQDLNAPKGKGNIYNALRIYNSGIAALNTANLSISNGATSSYVSDVANRLMGWDGNDKFGTQSACKGASSTQPTPTPTPTPSGVPPSQCGPGKYVTPPSMAADPTNQNCCGWYNVQSGDYCAKIAQAYNISLNQFYTWNNGLKTDCSNLMLGYQYCVSSNEAVSS